MFPCYISQTTGWITQSLIPGYLCTKTVGKILYWSNIIFTPREGIAEEYWISQSG
jgi:hypothetical protein